MAEDMAPKTSLRPRSREQGMGLGLRPKTREEGFAEKVARDEAQRVSEDFGDVEFRYDLDNQLAWNPLARLGFDPKKGKTGKVRDDAFYGAYVPERSTNIGKRIEESEGLKDFVGRVQPGDVFMSTTIAEAPVWSHEFTHRGIWEVEKKYQEDPQAFIDKYGDETASLLDSLITSYDRNERATELLDDLSTEMSGVIKNMSQTQDTKFTDRELKGREDLQEILKQGRVSDLGGLDKYTVDDRARLKGFSGILLAAEDILSEKGEPPLAKQEEPSFFQKMFKRLGFNEGGLAMEKQMKLFEEGGLSDDGMDRDPVTGNEIPPGSTAKNVRDDIPAQLSEGEYIVPADVVKYFGVKFFEDLRTRAKQGLREMDEDGRIGGEPMMPEGMGGEGLPDDIAGSIEDIDPRMLANLSEDEIRQLENIETMMPPRPRVQELSQEDKAALAQMTGMAMGGMVAPVDEDALIDRVIEAAKNNPNLSQKLKSRGVMMAEGGMVSQPGMMVDPYQQQKTMYSTGMAVGGLADSTTTESTFDPSAYQTIGGSYFNAGTGPVTIVEYVGPNGEILPVRTQGGKPIDPVPAGFKTKQQQEAEAAQASSVTAPTAIKPREGFDADSAGDPQGEPEDPMRGVDFNDPVGAAQAAAESVTNPGFLGAALSGGVIGTVSQLGNLSVANANAMAARDIYGEDSEEAQQAQAAVTAIENNMNAMAKGLKGLATGKSRYSSAKSYYDKNVQTVNQQTRSRTQSTSSRVSTPTTTSTPSRAATPSRGGGGDIYGGAPSVSMGEPTGGDGRGSTGTAPGGYGVGAGAGAPGAGVASGGRGGGFGVGPGAGAPGSGVAASTGGIDGPAADMGSPSSESGVSGANASAPGAEVGAGPGGSDAVGPFYKGGLVKRPNRKK